MNKSKPIMSYNQQISGCYFIFIFFLLLVICTTQTLSIAINKVSNMDQHHKMRKLLRGHLKKLQVEEEQHGFGCKCEWLFVFLCHPINRQPFKCVNPPWPNNNCSNPTTLSATKAGVENGWMGDCSCFVNILQASAG